MRIRVNQLPNRFACPIREQVHRASAASNAGERSGSSYRPSRRRLIQAAATGVGLLGLEVLAEHYGVGPLSRMDHSLTHIVQERNGIWYRGLPSRVAAAGFSLEKVLVRDSPRELIAFGDLHDPAIWKKQAELIDFLIRKHGYDSLGLEGVYGPPRVGMDAEVEREFEEVFEGKASITDYSRAIYINFSDKPTYEIVPIVSRAAMTPFQRFLDQQSIPTYGVEDRNNYFATLAIVGIFTCMRYVDERLTVRDQWGTPVAKSYKDIPNVDQLEDYVRLVQKKFPSLPLPGKTLLEMSVAMRNKNPDFERFNAFAVDLRMIRGNRLIAENVERSLTRLNSRRGILIVGDGHFEDSSGLLRHLAGLDQGMFADYVPLHELLSPSLLRVNPSL